jgi:hypothetical protein
MSGTGPQWFKSSYSDKEGGACLEVAYTWRKSSHSDKATAACVEMTANPHAIHVRDSKNPIGPAFTASPAAWSAFTTYATYAAA